MQIRLVMVCASSSCNACTGLNAVGNDTFGQALLSLIWVRANLLWCRFKRSRPTPDGI